MRFIYLLSFLVISHLTIQAQTTGSIRGTGKTSDGNPAEFVNVSIEGTTKGAVAGSTGTYEIRNVAPGSHTIIASFIGLENQKQTVEVKAGETTSVDFVLRENALQLEEVIISGRANLNREDVYVSKMPLKRMENSQVYNSVSS